MFVVAIHLLIVTTFIAVFYKFQGPSFMPPKKAARDLSPLRTIAQQEYVPARVTTEELEKQLIPGNVEQFRCTIRLWRE
jgi:hypothetical protein